MKFIRAILVVALSLSIAATASAQHTAGDSDSPTCEKCAQINDCLGRLNLDPDAAVQMDLPELAAGLDRTHLLDFVSRITTLLPAHIDKISLATIRSHYLPCMNAAVKRLASEEEIFRRMAMRREMLVDQYLSQDTPSEAVTGLLNEFCTLAYCMSNYAMNAEELKTLGVKNWCYNYLHYIEYTLYGDDTYMKNIDPAPEGLYIRLYSNFRSYSSNVPKRLEFEICDAVANAFDAEQYELITNNARDLIKLTIYTLPPYTEVWLGSILVTSSQAIGKHSELLNIAKEEYTNRYGSIICDNIFSSIETQNANTDLQTVADFLTYRNELREAGYRFADYLPGCVPYEFVDDNCNEIYAQYCYEFTKMLREVWKQIHPGDLSVGRPLNPLLTEFQCDEEIFVLVSMMLANQAFCYDGDTALALDIIEPALNYYNGIPIKNIVPYDIADIALIYYTLGNFDKAYEILYNYILRYIETCEYTDEFLSPDLICTAKCAAMLAACHREELAATLAGRVMSMVDRLQSDGEKAWALGLVCDSYYTQENYEKALEALNLALQYDMPEEDRAWLELGKSELYYKTKDWQQAVDTYNNYYSEQYAPMCTPAFYCEMMSCAAHIGDMVCMRSTADKYIENIKAEIDNKLYNLSSEERERFWSTIAEQNLFKEIWEAARGDEERQPILASCAYDYSLMMKGLLLSAGNRIDRMLTEHPDSIVRERYAQMKELSARLDNMSMRGGDPTQMQFLREAMTAAQRDINTAVRRMGIDSDMTGEHTVGWREVQSRLGEHEAAIEFMRLANGEDAQADPLYVAVVLRRGWESPRMVELCRESVLRNYVREDNLKNRRLYNTVEITRLWPLIWQPLQTYIAEGETVYFSADGVMNMMNIGAVRPSGEDRRMADDRYTLRRLSSTRELCIERGDCKPNRAVIYGGLNYDMGADAMSTEASAYNNSDLVASRGGFRGSTEAGLLPVENIYKETYNEAVDIADMLRSCDINSDLITDDRGIEESFKALSGQRFELLHMATHGFYMAGRTEYQTGEELLSPMMRSGLMMSRKKRPTPDDREDGLLLAREIADMDLSSVDMVVLSACQTALGDFSGDGIFGLQRGFKQAGAGTIVMTLWTIDSEMAQYMITEFYRNLIGGMERHEAFRDAQTKTKNAFPDKDWAAFIMLD